MGKSDTRQAALKKPPNTIFRQQKLQACTMLFSPKATIALFLVIGAVFLLTGGLLVRAAGQVLEVEVAYDCRNGTTEPRVDEMPCFVDFEVPDDMEPPVYVYYKLTDYYQNHKLYVRSRDDEQLGGGSKLPNDLECDEKFSLSPPDVDIFGVWSVADELDTMDNVVYPCGLVANSVFNDSFAIFDSESTPLALDETGISWATDREYKFKNAADGSTGTNFAPFAAWKGALCSELPTQALVESCDQAAAAASVYPGWCFPGSGYCVEDEHFIVWMRTAALPIARKRYATISEKVSSGSYTLRIAPRQYVPGDSSTSATTLYPVYPFGGTKSVVLASNLWVSNGDNSFLGVAYLCIGAMILVSGLAFCVKNMMSPRKPGHASFLEKMA